MAEESFSPNSIPLMSNLYTPDAGNFLGNTSSFMDINIRLKTARLFTIVYFLVHLILYI